MTTEYDGGAPPILRQALEDMRLRARAEGFAAAREKAAKYCDLMAEAYADGEANPDPRELAAAIRAMRDGAARCSACGHTDHDDNACPACKPGQCIRSDS